MQKRLNWKGCCRKWCYSWRSLTWQGERAKRRCQWSCAFSENLFLSVERRIYCWNTGEIKLSGDAKGTELKNKVYEEKGDSVHEAEISVAVIPVKEIKEETVYKSRKHKRE